MSNKRSLALLGASSMLLSILPGAALAQAPATKTFEQLQLSADKVKDSVEISSLWASRVGKAENVLVTTDAVFADSLASGALQGVQKAPLLFIDAKAGLDEQTVKTITGLGAKKVTILGGEKAISKEIAEALGKVAGVSEVARVSGESRVETSVAIAELAKAKDDTIIVARADDYADSLAAGALSARTGFPVVLTPKPYKVTGDDKKETEVVLHPAVEAYVKKANIKKIIVAGGPDAVADPTFNALKALVSDTTRAAGESRRETAVALAKLWESTGKVTVVDGYAKDNSFHNGFASALAASALGAPVILSNGTEKPSEAELALAGPNAQGVTGYCGTYVQGAFCKAVADKQTAAVKAVKLEDVSAILPLKVTPGDLAKLVGNAKTPPTRLYEVSDAKADVEYTITLAKGKKDEKGNIVLDLGNDGLPQKSDEAEISVVNDSTASGKNEVKVKAVAGKISFSIQAKKEDGNGYVVPILTAIDGEKPKVVGMGGAVHISPVAIEDGQKFSVASGNNNDWEVESVDREGKTIVIKNGDKKRTITFKENDAYTLMDTTGTNEVRRIDFAYFSKEISAGDKFKGIGNAKDSVYYSQATLPSTYYFVDAAPVGPTTALSDKTTPTQDTITLKLSKVVDGATVTVKAMKVTESKTYDYKGNEDKFNITRTFEAVKVGADGTFEAAITGLDPDSKYDFAVAQKVGEETSDFMDFAAAKDSGLADKTDYFMTTKQPEKVAIAKVDRMDDAVDDGHTGDTSKFLKVTLDSDKFDEGAIDPTLITLVANGTDVVTVKEAKSQYGTNALAGSEKKVGKQSDGVSRVFYIELTTPLNDVTPNVEYVLKLQQGAVKTKEGEKPSTPAEYKFSYR